jgi:hypothetical protein
MACIWRDMHGHGSCRGRRQSAERAEELPILADNA